MLEGIRVRVKGLPYDVSGEEGVVVSHITARVKVLLDKDAGKCENDLTLARWFWITELDFLYKEELRRTDDKIRKPFCIYDKDKEVLAIGHLYEQRNVSLTKRNDNHVSEQYSSFDAMLQTFSLDEIGHIIFDQGDC